MAQAQFHGVMRCDEARLGAHETSVNPPASPHAGAMAPTNCTMAGWPLSNLALAGRHNQFQGVISPLSEEAAKVVRCRSGQGRGWHEQAE
jgi:hypothetical protein